MKYSIVLPNGWTMSLVGIKDPVEAYETMTNVAKAADETGFETIWLVDHFHRYLPGWESGDDSPTHHRS